MKTARLARFAAFAATAAACARTAATEPVVRSNGASHEADVAVEGRTPARANGETTVLDAATSIRDASAPIEATTSSDAIDARARTPVDGPRYLQLAPGRPIYYALPGGRERGPARLIGHFHGVCGPPSYACGKWVAAAVDVGAIVCPTGNAKCGDSPVGPPSWEAPTWRELVLAMDHDLEDSIARVSAKHPHAIRREGAILTGYSRGAYAAPIVAGMHPGRWPFLVLIEADTGVTRDMLERARVRAVAFVAGEQGTEIAGMRKNVDALAKAGFPARLFVMPKTGHLYSDNMDEVMQAALAFVLEHEADGG